VMTAAVVIVTAARAATAVRAGRLRCPTGLTTRRGGLGAQYVGPTELEVGRHAEQHESRAGLPARLFFLADSPYYVGLSRT